MVSALDNHMIWVQAQPWSITQDITLKLPLDLHPDQHVYAQSNPVMDQPSQEATDPGSNRYNTPLESLHDTDTGIIPWVMKQSA